MARPDPLDGATLRRSRLPVGVGRGLRRAALTAGAALALVAAVAAQEPIALDELPARQGEVAAVAATLDDGALSAFAWELVAAAYGGRSEVDWHAVLGDVRVEVESRGDLGRDAVALAHQHGSVLITRGDYDEAAVVLEAALAQVDRAPDYRGWIESALVQVKSSTDAWVEALEHLDRAGDERGRTMSPESFGPWLDGLEAEVALMIGTPELAVEFVEAAWQAALESDAADGRWSAFDLYSRYLLTTDDHVALRAMEREVDERGWLDGASAERRGWAGRRFAAGYMESGQRSQADNAEARRRFADLLANDSLAPPDRTWSLIGLTLAQLDAGAVDEASATCAVLEAWLRGRGEADGGDPENPDAAKLVALQGLVAMARFDRGDLRADAPELAAAIDAARETWQTFREGWGEIPTFDGGISYLLLSNRQILIEALLGLGLRLEGAAAGAEAALDWLVEAHLQSTLAKRMDPAPCDFAAVRSRLLTPTRGLLAWVPLRGRSFVLAANDAEARMFELAPLFELEDRARDAIGAVHGAVHQPGDPARAQLERSLAAAGEAFLPAALLDYIEGWDSLYAVGLDDVGFLPLEMLDDGTGHSFGGSRAVTRLPSLPVGLRLVERAGQVEERSRDALVMVADRPDPVAAANFGVEAFDASDRGVGDLARSLAAVRTRTVRGPRAALAKFGEPDARTDGLWHLVAHGVRRLDRRPPGILLSAPDGAVFAEHVEALRAPPLVLLSVCGAARSDLRRGDGGRSDLAAAFFMAGAVAVASSASDLDLEPTLRVGERVHAALARGSSLAEALRRTRATFDGGDDRFGREWLAAHVLHANGAAFEATLPPTATGGRTAAIVVAGVALLAAGLVLAGRVKRRGDGGRAAVGTDSAS